MHFSLHIYLIYLSFNFDLKIPMEDAQYFFKDAHLQGFLSWHWHKISAFLDISTFVVSSKYFCHSLCDFCLCMRTFQILFWSQMNMLDWKQCLWGLKSNKKIYPCRKSIFRKALIFLKPFEFMAKRKLNTVWLHLSCVVLSGQTSC